MSPKDFLLSVFAESPSVSQTFSSGDTLVWVLLWPCIKEHNMVEEYRIPVPSMGGQKPKPPPEITKTPSMLSLIRLPRHGHDLRIKSDDQLVTANYNLSHCCLLHLWGANPRSVRDEHHLSQTCSLECVCVFGYVCVLL